VRGRMVGERVREAWAQCVGGEQKVRVHVGCGWKQEVAETPLLGVIRIECRVCAGQIKGGWQNV
jgi:1,4-dihydroxy-2-naphthoyl-CoA synthase